MQNCSLSFRDIDQASAFVTGMKEKFRDSLPHLLMVLTAPGGQSLKRLRSVISMCGGAVDLDRCFLPILDLLLRDELSMPMHAKRRGDLLLDLFNTPGLCELLLESLSDLKESGSLCLFLLEICRQFLEARHSEKVHTLAAALRDLNSPNSSRLCSYIVLKKESTNQKESGLLVPQVAVWGNDLLPPGGHHDNDFLNFRDISIIPTVDEVSGGGAQTSQYLPFHSGDNAFIQEDPEASYIDSIFRLYREDMVRSLREELFGQKRRWNCTRVMELDCGLDRPSNRKVNRSPALVLRLALPDQLRSMKRTQRENLWKHSKSLQKGTLICLCRSDGDPNEEEFRPIAFGTIATRELSWLCHEDGPFIRIMLNRIEDIVKCVSDIGAQKNRNLSIIEACRSFFTYECVLRRLQTMETVPFSDELVHGSKMKLVQAICRTPCDYLQTLP